jgi:hypothetical protein
MEFETQINHLPSFHILQYCFSCIQTKVIQSSWFSDLVLVEDFKKWVTIFGGSPIIFHFLFIAFGEIFLNFMKFFLFLLLGIWIIELKYLPLEVLLIWFNSCLISFLLVFILSACASESFWHLFIQNWPDGVPEARFQILHFVRFHCEAKLKKFRLSKTSFLLSDPCYIF